MSKRSRRDLASAEYGLRFRVASSGEMGAFGGTGLMWTVTTISLLVGGVLGLRFNLFILVPTLGLALIEPVPEICTGR
jgi:hypothetical protein